MYINGPDDKNQIISWISGYEAGRGNRLGFGLNVKLLMRGKYKTPYSNDGWPGQIERYARKNSMSWPVAFRRITIELIGNLAPGDSARKKAAQMLKSRIGSIIDRIHPSGNPWFNDSWIAEWKSLCLVENKWFRTLWSKQEWLAIKAIDTAVQQRKVFKPGTFLPRPELLKLKERYEAATVPPASAP